ncbi:MAG: RimK/LysX family protein, partial [Gammaproteobacteria bacterium]|nr:RimK/LysX family protein [Gammaproteobacteria bacterium]
DIRLGDQLQTTEFTLTDRGRMTYPVLLGRAFLMDLYVIDVSRSYTHERYKNTD